MKKLLAAVVVLFGLGTAANAMDLSNKLEVGGGYAQAIPTTGDVADHVKTSQYWSLFADYKVLDNVYVGLEYAESNGYDTKHIDNMSSIDSNYFGVRGKYNVPVTLWGVKGNAYGLLGIARYRWDTDPHQVSDNGIGTSLGLGLNMDVTEHIFAGVEGRYHFAPTFDMEENESISAEFMTLGVQAGYRF
jgi:Opacity protein and related surface antigens